MPLDDKEIELRKREADRPLHERYPHLGLWIVFVGLVVFSAIIAGVVTYGR